MSIKGLFPIDKWNFKSESVLHELPEEDIAILTSNLSEARYKKGEVIFREGTYATGIYYVVSGKAKKYKVNHEDREKIIYIANAGELIGYHAILSEERYPDSAATLEDSIISFIPKDDFLKALNQSKVLSKRLLKTLSHEFGVLANGLSAASNKTARERVAIQLIVLREKYKSDADEGNPVEINMSRDDLANLVGTARENVVRILSEFKSSGIVETRGRKIIVLDVPRLITVANYR